MAPQLVHEFAIWLQARAPLFRIYAAQKIVKPVFHGPSVAQNEAAQKRDKTETKVGQVRDRTGTYGPLFGPPEPKPQGLGMVSFSNFTLQMLQIVALRSQTVAGFRAKPKLLQTVHKLLQSVAEPKKTGGWYYLQASGACLLPAADRLDLLRGYSFTVWPQGDDRTQPMESPDAARSCPAKKQSRLAGGTWRQRTRSVPSAFPAVKVRKKNETVEIAAAPIRGTDGR